MKHDNRDFDFGFCGTANVTKLDSTMLISNFESLRKDFSENKIQFYRDNIAYYVLHAFMGSTVYSIASSYKSGMVEENFASLEVLDAFIEPVGQ